MPADAHVHCYTHRQGTLTISVKKLSEILLTGEREGKIWMWHRCLRCPRIDGFPPATRRVVMSDAAWGLSFGKFLELSFSNHAAASRVASCGHSLHRDCLRFYGCGKMVACFRYASIDVYSVYVPPAKVDFNYEIQDWIQKEADEVLERADLLFYEVRNAVRQIADKTYGGLGAGIDCSESRIATLEGLLQNEMTGFEEMRQRLSNREMKKGHPSHDILEINRLRMQLLFRSYIWDQRLVNAASGEALPADQKVIKSSNLEDATVNIVKPLETAFHSKASPDHTKNFVGQDFLSASSPSTGNYEPPDPLECGSTVRRAASDSQFIDTLNRLDAAWTGKTHPGVGTKENSLPLMGSISVDSSLAVVAERLALESRVEEKGVAKATSSSSPGASTNSKGSDSAEDTISWLGMPFLSIYQSVNKNFLGNTQKFSNSTYISSARDLGLQGGAKWLLPEGSNDPVIPIYDDEPTSIISYALISKDYHTQLSDDGEKPKDIESASSMPAAESASFHQSVSPNDSLNESNRSLSIDDSILSTSGARNSFMSDPLLYTKSLHIRVAFTVDGPVDKVKYTVTCYYAKHFDALRKICCPSELDYVRSLSRCKKWGAQGGKSNVFFAKTLDDRFIIKQVTKTELESFITFAPEYFKYLMEAIDTKSPTCLAKILGIYQVTTKNLKGGKELKMDVLVMENLLYRRNVTKLYDLKGSSSADFADCVELQPELKRLKLRKNNWDSDTYEFDEVLTEFASQKRIYEVVAKPVVESVLDGYNGTIMAYGQTGTGKTYTLGQLGEEDTAGRGIMVRAMEDILAGIRLDTDTVLISYFQLYMETIQDLLNPSNDNISIMEDPKSGDVSLPGASCVEIKDQKSFLELLRLGEAHRFATNTKLNTESSRSHAILMVHVRRSVKDRDSALPNENGSSSHVKNLKPSVVRKGKLVVVDLAGSERIDKSGSDGHALEEAKSINLSLSALGKCINALAENSAHVPVRDSKLTRLLRDSFGGTARTSLVVTIGPSSRHRGETASTIMFGQRAMKVENMLKIKEEFDYKSLSRKLDIQLDKLMAESERLQKAFQDRIDQIDKEAQDRVSDAERKYADALEEERLKYQKDYMEAVKKLEEQWAINQRKQSNEASTSGAKHDMSVKSCTREACQVHANEEVTEVKRLLQSEKLLRKAAEDEASNLKMQLAQSKKQETAANSEMLKLHQMLKDEANQREKLEREIAMLQGQLLQLSFEADETRRRLDNGTSKVHVEVDTQVTQVQGVQPQTDDAGNEDKSSVAKLFEQVGLQKILSLLEAEDADVRIHAVKVVANLAAEETNQEKIVEAGGLTSLLNLLRSSEDETIHRVAAGAIANLAMNETNQELIMAQGGVSLLSVTATKAEDPQTLRMIAGAVANLCGNDKLQAKLRGEGGIKALLGMVRFGHPDVLAQVARGIANFAKCESRASTQGFRTGRSLLIEDGALPWIVHNSNNEASSIRRHIELALCHLAQHEANAKDMINGGALWELVRISRDCSRDDIRSLARRTLGSSPSFQAELRRLNVDH